jgi:hypothetical protein
VPTIEGFAPHRVVFIPDPDDQEERLAIAEAGGEQMPSQGTYGRKINHGVRNTDEPLIFIGADDLEPQPDWFEAARARMNDDIVAVGINDMIRRPERPTHATHFLVHRLYAQQPCIDGTPGPLFEGYIHCCTDDEFIVTGQRRQCYAYAHDSLVRHLHPIAGLAPWDDTYEKGTSRMGKDLQQFRYRMSRWT